MTADRKGKTMKKAMSPNPGEIIAHPSLFEVVRLLVGGIRLGVHVNAGTHLAVSEYGLDADPKPYGFTYGRSRCFAGYLCLFRRQQHQEYQPHLHHWRYRQELFQIPWP